MARRGRRPVLDEIKKREILAILSVGCSRATAAGYVGCAPNTILNTARRDPEFAEQLRRTEKRAEVEYMKSIQQAARQEKYWRAAAWALERKNPSDYGSRRPDVLTPAEAEQLVERIVTIIVECLPDGRSRHVLLKRLNQLLVELRGPESPRNEDDEPETVSGI
jgi:vacuolar-type H+-ATPase subunit H